MPPLLLPAELNLTSDDRLLREFNLGPHPSLARALDGAFGDGDILYGVADRFEEGNLVV